MPSIYHQSALNYSEMKTQKYDTKNHIHDWCVIIYKVLHVLLIACGHMSEWKQSDTTNKVSCTWLIACGHLTEWKQSDTKCHVHDWECGHSIVI